MNPQRVLGVVLTLVLACTACGDDPAPAESAAEPTSEPVSGRSAAQNTPPELRQIAIEPSRPLVGQPVRATVSTVDAEGDRLELRYVWRIDGEVLGENGREIQLQDARAGSVVEVRVTASDGLSETAGSAEVVVADQTPVLVGLIVEPPKKVTPGDTVTASAQGRDPEGAPLDFEYEWTVNGERVAVGDMLRTKGLQSGDEIQVTAWALDRSNRSEPLTSGVVEVGSAHPEIVSTPPGFREDGVFEYAVEAVDPDGDRRLRYELEQGPEGMRIDLISGELHWRPSHAQTGVHVVKVVVRDSSRLETSQTFEVTVRDASESVPAAQAPPED